MTYSNADPKPVTYKNEDYLKFIRTLPCIICDQEAEPCHVRRLYFGAGTSQKPHDYVAIPGCRKHHNHVENLETVHFQIIKCLMKYIESKRKKK
jgi:hypothetical protein